MAKFDVMKSISPSGPLLTLIIKPLGASNTNDLLARFHPIMKSMGYGNFEMEENGLYQASKNAETLLGAPLFVFAEQDGSSLVINIDGHSIFGLKGVEEQLKKIRSEYEKSIDCSTELSGPNYVSALVGNLLYTALPIYLSATLIAVMFYFIEYDRQIIFNTYMYATLGIIGAKTRFWVNQRRKQRPVWQSILLLVVGAPIILGVVVALVYGITRLT